jgi:hypothetical protein
LVRQKVKKPTPKERIPRWLHVKIPGRLRRMRVEIDVISLLGASGKPGRFTQGRGWPTAGRLDIGRLFATHVLPPGTPMSTLPSLQAEVGTTGSLVRVKRSGAIYAVTASHVFLDLCAGDRDAPNDDRAIAVTRQDWAVVPNQSYYPLTVTIGDWIRDCLAFRAPNNFCPTTPSWPDGFTGELATQDDTDRALLSTTPTGFIWVERGASRPVMIPIDIDAFIDPAVLVIERNGQSFDLGFVQTWRSRFLPGADTPTNQRATMGGDSGAAVFVWAENNTNCRLLGFHFYEPDDQTMSYAVDARWFFRQAFGEGFGIDYSLLI